MGGHGFANGLVPGEFSFFDEHSGSDSSEQFRIRGNLMKTGWREGQLFFVIAVAVTFGEDEFVVNDDAHADARCIPVF
jgi:hypothetical protein